MDIILKSFKVILDKLKYNQFSKDELEFIKIFSVKITEATKIILNRKEVKEREYENQKN